MKTVKILVTAAESKVQPITELLRSSLVKLRREINGELQDVYCIGFLVSKEFAYSAAHCLILAKQKNNKEVVLEQINTLRIEKAPNESYGAKSFIHKIHFFIVHSFFNGNIDIGYNADFGIIKVSFVILNITMPFNRN